MHLTACAFMALTSSPPAVRLLDQAAARLCAGCRRALEPQNGGDLCGGCLLYRSNLERCIQSAYDRGAEPDTQHVGALAAFEAQVAPLAARGGPVSPPCPITGEPVDECEHHEFAEVPS